MVTYTLKSTSTSAYLAVCLVRLRRYNGDLRGVLCTYSDVTIPRAGHVVSSVPYVHFHVGLKVRRGSCSLLVLCASS